MKGGVGTDLFVFQPEFEGVISNFVAGQDVLQLHHTGLTNVQAMIDAHALTVTQHGKDTIVDVRAPGHYNNGIWHDHDQIVLKGVTLSLFGTDSFLIA